jgi:hypothetical protein
VLTAFLLSPAHHEQLLPLLKRWPPQLYSVTALTEATLHRCQQHTPIPLQLPCWSQHANDLDDICSRLTAGRHPTFAGCSRWEAGRLHSWL